MKCPNCGKQMNDKLTKITLTFPMRYDTPNRNGTVYTKEAIENAFGNSNPQMPILAQVGVSRDDEFAYPIERCVGTTTQTYYFDWDDKNKVCNATIEGYLFNTAPNIRINEMKDGVITDCDIMSISIL